MLLACHPATPVIRIPAISLAPGRERARDRVLRTKGPTPHPSTNQHLACRLQSGTMLGSSADHRDQRQVVCMYAPLKTH